MGIRVSRHAICHRNPSNLLVWTSCLKWDSYTSTACAVVASVSGGHQRRPCLQQEDTNSMILMLGQQQTQGQVGALCCFLERIFVSSCSEVALQTAGYEKVHKKPLVHSDGRIYITQKKQPRVVHTPTLTQRCRFRWLLHGNYHVSKLWRVD